MDGELAFVRASQTEPVHFLLGQDSEPMSVPKGLVAIASPVLAAKLERDGGTSQRACVYRLS